MSNGTRVKTCGITRIEDALLAAELDAWAVGFVFYRRSSRAVEARVAASIRASLPKQIKAVGVFVDSSIAEIHECLALGAIDTVQLHGSEPDSFAKQIKTAFPEAEVYKALRVKGKEDVSQINCFPTCDAILLDAYVDGTPGGTGHTFDWSLLEPSRESLVPLPRLIVSGGLRPENVRAAINRFSPYAVDVSSGIEERPGVKSEKLMRAFFSAAGEAMETRGKAI